MKKLAITGVFERSGVHAGFDIAFNMFIIFTGLYAKCKIFYICLLMFLTHLTLFPQPLFHAFIVFSPWSIQKQCTQVSLYTYWETPHNTK
jgi:hypothetical protein